MPAWRKKPVLDKTERCPHCGRFPNRGVSVDAIIIRKRKVLLIQRGVEPDKGLWGTPGGYVSWDESAEEAVKREVKEEVNLEATKVYLVKVNSDPSRHPSQTINLVYFVEVKDGELQAGDDALVVQWFSLDDLPKKMALDHKRNIQELKAS